MEPVTTWIDRGWYIAVEFELSTSARMEEVLDLARQNPHFVELMDERGVTVYRVIFFKNDFPKFDQLMELVGNWKSTTLYLKGNPVNKDHQEEWLACYRVYWGHRKTLNTRDFCGLSKLNRFPDFLGCYERNIYLRWRDPLYSYYQHHSKAWYTFGKRVRDRFVVDKPAMTAFLNKINADYDVCPCYDLERIEHAIHKLPAEINPVVHPEWQFKEQFLASNPRTSVNQEIALTTLNDIVPVDEKAYNRFMERIFTEE
jgi:hypothetical protein